MTDSLSRIYCKDLNLRAYITESKATASEIIALKHTGPIASYVFGQSINAALLLSASLKPESDQNLTYKIECSGPVKSIIVQVDAKGNLRGTIFNPLADPETAPQTISKALGAGLVTVSKDIGMKEPYVGVSHLAKGDIAFDTAYYLHSSEQVPSAMLIGFSINETGAVEASAGILIQSFPDTPAESLDKVEQGIASLKPSMTERLISGENPLKILSAILGTESFEILSTIPVQHRCRCTRELVGNTLKLIEKSELEAMLHEDNGAEISCTFCEKRYQFSHDELEEIINTHSSEA